MSRAAKSSVDKTFPKLILVTREPDGDDSYLLAHESPAELTDSGQTVAVYQRVEIAAMKGTNEVVRADGSVVSILD